MILLEVTHKVAAAWNEGTEGWTACLQRCQHGALLNTPSHGTHNLTIVRGICP
jgi:hypothetical protein